MNNKKIIVCICTYKRPIYLKECIESVLAQSYKKKFEIVVVDNDNNQSALSVVKEINNSKIHYYVENKRGIASARNKCVNVCKQYSADYLIFIDDDEIADQNWLQELLLASEKYQSSIIIGPVLCKFEKKPNSSIEKVFFTRKRHKNGKKMTNGATGNVLLNMKVLKHFNNNPFDEKFNSMPGEDSDFFKKTNKLNYNVIWCDTAITFENISKNRSHITACLIRSFNSGNSTYYIYKKQKGTILTYIKCFFEIINLILHTILFIVFFMLSFVKSIRFYYYKQLFKIFKWCGFLSGLFKYRNKYYLKTTYGK